MPMLPRPAGRSSLPGVVTGLAVLPLLLGACSSGGPTSPEEPSSSPASSASSASSAAPESSAPSSSEPAPGDPAEPSGQQYVALGDSYTAAPLVPTTDTSDGCLQSDGNYPHLLAAELGHELTDVSCVGATSTSMIGVQQTPNGETRPAQFDAITPGTDLVSIGIGGNDVRLFETLLRRCFPLAQDDPRGAPCTEELQGSRADLLPAVRALEARVEAIVTGVQQRAPQAEVVVVTYPQLLPRTGTCEEAPLAKGDYPYVRRVNTVLSQSLAAGAEAAGAEVVDLLAMSRGHDVCSDEPWVNGVQTDPQRALAFHPFAVEQEAVADAIVELVG